MVRFQAGRAILYTMNAPLSSGCREKMAGRRSRTFKLCDKTAEDDPDSSSPAGCLKRTSDSMLVRAHLFADFRGLLTFFFRVVRPPELFMHAREGIQRFRHIGQIDIGILLRELATD